MASSSNFAWMVVAICGGGYQYRQLAEERTRNEYLAQTFESMQRDAAVNNQEGLAVWFNLISCVTLVVTVLFSCYRARRAPTPKDKAFLKERFVDLICNIMVSIEFVDDEFFLAGIIYFSTVVIEMGLVVCNPSRKETLFFIDCIQALLECASPCYRLAAGVHAGLLGTGTMSDVLNSLMRSPHCLAKAVTNISTVTGTMQQYDFLESELKKEQAAKDAAKATVKRLTNEVDKVSEAARKELIDERLHWICEKAKSTRLDEDPRQYFGFCLPGLHKCSTSTCYSLTRNRGCAHCGNLVFCRSCYLEHVTSCNDLRRAISDDLAENFRNIQSSTTVSTPPRSYLA